MLDFNSCQYEYSNGSTNRRKKWSSSKCAMVLQRVHRENKCCSWFFSRICKFWTFCTFHIHFNGERLWSLPLQDASGCLQAVSLQFSNPWVTITGQFQNYSKPCVKKSKLVPFQLKLSCFMHALKFQKFRRHRHMHWIEVSWSKVSDVLLRLYLVRAMVQYVQEWKWCLVSMSKLIPFLSNNSHT